MYCGSDLELTLPDIRAVWLFSCFGIYKNIVRSLEFRGTYKKNSSAVFATITLAYFAKAAMT
jgi:hypothetical protein